MRGTAVFLASSVICASALVCVSVGTAQEADPGERIMNASCQTSCHTVRSIQTQAMDSAAWTKTVGTMVDMISVQRAYANAAKALTTLDGIRATISNELGKVSG